MSKDTISFNFGLLFALPFLVLPCWNALLPSAKQHRVLAQRVGGSSPLCSFCWFTLLNHRSGVLILRLWEWCNKRGCLCFVLLPPRTSGAGTPGVTQAARGPGKLWRFSAAWLQKGSCILRHQHPPTSSPANSNSWDVTKHIQESQTARSQASHPVLPLCCLRSIIINYQFFRNAINLTAV